MYPAPTYNISVRTYPSLDVPSVLNILQPSTTSIIDLYEIVAVRLRQSMIKIRRERQEKDKNDEVAETGPAPNFVLRASTGFRIPTKSALPISTLMPEAQKTKHMATLTLDMSRPFGDKSWTAPEGNHAGDQIDESSGDSESSSDSLSPPEEVLPPDTKITLLVKGITGLEPRASWGGVTQAINVTAQNTISDMYELIRQRFNMSESWFYGGNPQCPIVVTTLSRRSPDPASQDSVATLLSPAKHKGSAHLISIFLSARLLGGKGGFGSQLRAAGGRMSSRKNRNQTAEQQNASNRNLDGRRIRTVTEAKNLAAYLTMKPDMDKKEKEERRKRWEAVVEAAERKEEEIKRGKGGNVRLDGQWVEQKEDVENKTRDAVLAAMKAGLIGNEAIMHDITGSESSGDEVDSDEAIEGEASGSSASSELEEKATTSKPTTAAPATRIFFGWDEDDEDMSEEEDEEGDDEEEIPPVAYEGKGKGKA